MSKPKQHLKNFPIDTSWTLFLDRDGVINRRIIDDYVKDWDEFEFLPGVLDALKILSGQFAKILVVSNQQGVGKGLMSGADVELIHSKMLDAIRNKGGKIDRVYYCPELATDKPGCRKPYPGMAYQAQKDFPGIDFEQSVMVGDSLSDMKFSENLGMKKVYISTDKKDIPDKKYFDFIFPDLHTFARNISSIKIK